MERQRQRKSSAQPWTDAEKKRLLSLSVDDRSWKNIARAFPGRSANACKQQCNIMLREAQGLFRAQRVTERKANGRIRRTASDLKLMAAPPQPPAEHASITAAFFGDPPPGRSALDRKRALPPSDQFKLSAAFK